MKNRDQSGEAGIMMVIILMATLLSIINTVIENKNPDGVSVIQADPNKQK